MLPVYSVTKSVLSILIGIAIDRGQLRLDDKLGDLLPETLQTDVDPSVRHITVRRLLTMTAGFVRSDEDPHVPLSDMWRWMLNGKLIAAGGAKFTYNSWSPNLLSVVLDRATKQTGAGFAQESLFDPLDIRNYAWPFDAEGHLVGDTGLSLTARDMAKIGQLYLNRGRWGDARIVSENYVADSTARHTQGGPPVNASYGYLWWIEPGQAGIDAFFAAGSGSQLIYVVPARRRSSP
jgi:CubicO group peptidase (beta-lactamase class C family)